MKGVFGILLFLPVAGYSAATSHIRAFSSPSYDVVLAYNCPHARKVCEQVTFTASHKKTGMIEVLRGKKLHSTGVDFENKATQSSSEPSSHVQARYIYKFIAPNKQTRIITYDGKLLKMVDNKVVFQEQGHWKNQ